MPGVSQPNRRWQAGVARSKRLATSGRTIKSSPEPLRGIRKRFTIPSAPVVWVAIEERSCRRTSAFPERSRYGFVTPRCYRVFHRRTRWRWSFCWHDAWRGCSRVSLDASVVLQKHEERQKVCSGSQDMGADLSDETLASGMSEQRWHVLRSYLARMLGNLDRREKLIICARFALGSHRREQSLRAFRSAGRVQGAGPPTGKRRIGKTRRDGGKARPRRARARVCLNGTNWTRHSPASTIDL